ncbi:RNA polymerase sigma-70 factor [Chitinophaga nivalis]|uniref:RNA polymerase sigma-70 factor n=1 Tax=Chitinophaga nivalis TaxID=2991709 RepID=A0ABT3IM92_9BACT|nr:RNA polymerase sigma-70 factor [Chitinophaga nivalis]MCW3465239.1 RNA polymerase sigma-70 factor [Chitinophaga nivalis]MCW3485069.1 RNA polymerase sigma-70 factor [Chitinophaga nivalis]
MDLQQDKLAEAAERYFHTYFEGLHRYAFTMLKDNDDAKDAVQTVFLRLWEKQTLLNEQQSVKSYLYTAVYNQCLNMKRHDKIKERYMTAQHGDTGDPGNPLISKETSRQILALIGTLPPQCRLIFSKSRFEEMKYAEIAADMGLSVKTVEAQMGKALKILREKLAPLLIVMIIFFTLYKSGCL